VLLIVFIPEVVVSEMNLYLALCAKVSGEIEKLRSFVNERGD
jgi:hypothetical protein